MGGISMKGRLIKHKALIFSVSIIALFTVSFSILSYCITDKDIEIVQVHADRIVYKNLNELINAADVVVIGEFCKKTEQSLEYTFDEELKKDIISNTISQNVISVKKILKGDVVDPTIKVSQRYGIDENQNKLITFSELTPMKEADEWIFFLYYDKVYDTYWCAGDYTGRYPVPNEEILHIYENVKNIVNKRNEWLDTKEKIADSQVESTMMNDDYVYTDASGINYLLHSKEEADIVMSFNDEISLCADGLKASDFGLYEKDLINIELYCDILEAFHLTQN